MARERRWPRFATAMSFVVLLATAFVLYRSALGQFRSMVGFPLVFAIIVTLVLVVSTVLDRRPGRRLRAGLAALTIVLAAIAPVAQNRYLRAERRAVEARGMEALAGRPAPEIRHIAAIGSAALAEAASFAPGEHVTLVNFWATWCSPCVEELPLLDAFWREHRDAGFELVGVTRLYGSREESLPAIHEFLAGLEVGYPVLVEDDDSPAHTAYRVRSLPTSVLIDRGGRVVDYGAGIDGTERLLERARELLAGPG